MMRRIYPLKVKAGAFDYMSKILRYSEQVDRRLDDSICRITVTDYSIEYTTKEWYHKELAKDRMLQVKVYGIEDREFLVLSSLVESLGGDIIIVEEEE